MHVNGHCEMIVLLLIAVALIGSIRAFIGCAHIVGDCLVPACISNVFFEETRYIYKQHVNKLC